MSIYYVNGIYVDEDQAHIPARDLAVLRGYGAFDYLRTYHGEPFRLAENVARLRQSCAMIGLVPNWTDDELIAIVQETLCRNQAHPDHHHGEYNIRIVVTGGVALDNITPIDGDAGLIVMVAPVVPAPAIWYEQGVTLATFQTQRIFPASKSINYIPAIVAMRHARAIGAIEALYVDDEGNVTECTTSNVFAFIGDVLVTPPIDGSILPGRTRSAILELVRGHYTVEERPITVESLYGAHEVFITSANKRVVPVVQVDEHSISPAPGERTRHIMALFDHLTLGKSLAQSAAD